MLGPVPVPVAVPVPMPERMTPFFLGHTEGSSFGDIGGSFHHHVGAVESRGAEFVLVGIGTGNTRADASSWALPRQAPRGVQIPMT